MSEKNSPEKPSKAYSCVRCFERKVKCDKRHPCANCIKSNVDCQFRIPAAPRRKKKRLQEDILLARLKEAEDLLESKGIDIRSELATESQRNAREAVALAGPDSQPIIQPRPRPEKARLLIDHGRQRFIENNLWNSVSEEFQEPKEAMDDTSSAEDDEEDNGLDEGNEFLLGMTPSASTITQLHPPPETIFRLWQVYLENFNPMTKIIHQPSMQEALIKATTDIEHVSRGMECLMFAMYNGAVITLEEDECQRMFGESRKTLLSRYRQGARRSLARAKFLGTSNFTVLQAFVIYILTTREFYDSRTLWTLTGVATRIAQGIGVHRDGKGLGLPPFEVEMGRRLWWQIIILDFRSAELTGSVSFGDPNFSDTQVPTNVNDVDIWPGMKEPPTPATKATEMITLLLRCEFGRFMKEKILGKVKCGHQFANSVYATTTKPPGPDDLTIEEADSNINELEKLLEDKFLRYCDPSIPLQFTTSLIGRAAIGRMRLMAHHPRRYPSEADVPPKERKLLWETAVKLLETDNLAHNNKCLRKFMWHTNIYFHWQALIYMLGRLKEHTVGEEVDAAWRQVDEIFENHPDFVNDYKKPLHVAVGSLCLKAFDARIQGIEHQQREQKFPFTVKPTTPPYIEKIRQQRQELRRKAEIRQAAAAKTESTSTTAGSIGPQSSMSTNISPTSYPSQTSQSTPFNPSLSFAANTTFSQHPQQQPSVPFSSQPAIPWPSQSQFQSQSQPFPNNSFSQTALPGNFNFNYDSTPSSNFDMTAMMLDGGVGGGGVGTGGGIGGIDDGSADIGMNMNWMQWDYLIQDLENT